MARVKKKQNIDNEQIENALLKRALGFESHDVVEEFSVDENSELKLTKKKITKKYISPDIQAAKVLLEFYFNEKDEDFFNMTDAELENEKLRLLTLLKDYKEDIDNDNNKNLE